MLDTQSDNWESANQSPPNGSSELTTHNMASESPPRSNQPMEKQSPVKPVVHSPLPHISRETSTPGHRPPSKSVTMTGPAPPACSGLPQPLPGHESGTGTLPAHALNHSKKPFYMLPSPPPPPPEEAPPEVQQPSTRQTNSKLLISCVPVSKLESKPADNDFRNVVQAIKSPLKRAWIDSFCTSPRDLDHKELYTIKCKHCDNTDIRLQYNEEKWSNTNKELRLKPQALHTVLFSRIKQNTSSDDVASSSKTSIENKIVSSQLQSRETERKISANIRETEPSTSNKNEATGNENISIGVWIEDREAAIRGPISLNMPRTAVMGDLRRQAFASFGLAAHLQRWFVGRTLCTDDNTPLISLAGTEFETQFYLRLVEPETDNHTTSRLEPTVTQWNTSSDDVASSSKTSIENKIVSTQLQSREMERKISANIRETEPSTSNKNEATGNENISIGVWIEDREAAIRGPISLNMPRTAVMGDLRRQAFASFGLAAHLQRWFVGRTQCTDDNTPLISLAGTEFETPFYLRLVEPETNKHTTSPLEPMITQWNTSSDDVASSSKTSIENKIVPMQPQSREMERKIPANIRETEPLTSNKNEATGNENISIGVWIEDREAAIRGPISLNMPRAAVMGDLRRQAFASFGLAAHLQRWFVGRTLCTDDNTPLISLAGTEFETPFYLRLVEPETNKHTTSRLEPTIIPNKKTDDKIQTIVQTNVEKKTTDIYAELVLLERRALVSNTEEFECGVCVDQYKPGQGAVLRECLHTFCKECLSDVVKHSEEPAVSCPVMGCSGLLHEREIRALVSPEEYERWLARGLAAAESGTRNAFHCKTRDCQGWAVCEPGVTRFPCPVCKRTNCVPCQVIHEGNTCEQYRVKLQKSEARAREGTDERTGAFLDKLLSRGEALECPECSVIIIKDRGCDWIRCSACKTEICWVTRGRRWGPRGRGDTSAGCRCGVRGRRCHPSCGYCH